MNVIDTHMHFDTFVEKDIVEEIVDAALEAGVVAAVAIGGSSEANITAAEVARAYPHFVRYTAGFDRGEVGQEVDWGGCEALLAAEACVGVGETGLDYHYQAETRREQMELFEANLERALRFSLPVIIHSREADEDTLSCLSHYVSSLPGGRDNPGILHCFTGTIPFARKLLDLGLYISFSGITTFKNAESLREVAAFVPLDRMLIETDSPYLAPIPHRGERNQPAYVPEVARCIAKVREREPEDIATATTDNARRCFVRLPLS